MFSDYLQCLTVLHVVIACSVFICGYFFIQTYIPHVIITNVLLTVIGGLFEHRENWSKVHSQPC